MGVDVPFRGQDRRFLWSYAKEVFKEAGKAFGGINQVGRMGPGLENLDWCCKLRQR